GVDRSAERAARRHALPRRARASLRAGLGARAARALLRRARRRGRGGRRHGGESQELARSSVRSMKSLAVCFALVCGYAHGGVLPETNRSELIRMVLDNFWGKAKLPSGQFVQPASEEERTTVPISKAAAHRAIDAGEISGL